MVWSKHLLVFSQLKLKHISVYKEMDAKIVPIESSEDWRSYQALRLSGFIHGFGAHPICTVAVPPLASGFHWEQWGHILSLLIWGGNHEFLNVNRLNHPAELSKTFKYPSTSSSIPMTQTYGSSPSCENINCIVDPGFKGTMLHMWILNASVIQRALSTAKNPIMRYFLIKKNVNISQLQFRAQCSLLQVSGYSA